MVDLFEGMMFEIVMDCIVGFNIVGLKFCVML